MKLFLIILLAISFVYSESHLSEEEITKSIFIDLAKETKNNSLIKESNNFRYLENHSLKSLNLYKRTEYRPYIENLYIKYPEYKKLIYVNFDTNHKNINPFDIQENDLRINQSSYLISKEKKFAYIKILTSYFSMFVFILIFFVLLLWVFLENKYYRFLFILTSISLIVSSTIYIYMVQHIFKLFNHFFLSNLGMVILLTGGILSYLSYKIKDNQKILTSGILISIISSLIVGILSLTFL